MKVNIMKLIILDVIELIIANVIQINDNKHDEITKKHNNN